MCRGWATSRCPAQRKRNFPIMLILQVIVNAQTVLQYGCPEDTLQFHPYWNASTNNSTLYFLCCYFLPSLSLVYWRDKLLLMAWWVTSCYQNPRLPPRNWGKELFFLPFLWYSLLPLVLTGGWWRQALHPYIPWDRPCSTVTVIVPGITGVNLP